MARGRRKGYALIVLGAAALLASWNPASAPLGLAVGIATATLSLAERRRAGRFESATRVALVLSVGAALASATVVALLAGAGRGREGQPIVEGNPPSARREALDQAAEATRARREAARKELEALDPRR